MWKMDLELRSVFCRYDVLFKSMAREPTPDVSGKGCSLENILVPGRADLHVR